MAGAAAAQCVSHARFYRRACSNPKILQNLTFVISTIKTFLRDQLGLPPWIVLIAAGFILHALCNIVFRRPLSSPWGLVGPLVVGVAIETYEIWRHYRLVGLFAPENDPLWMILGRHGLDVLLMLALPAAFVAASAIFARPG